jgi:hypothetical protein
MGDLKTDN